LPSGVVPEDVLLLPQPASATASTAATPVIVVSLRDVVCIDVPS
jgi:hypothetical protein